MHYFAVNNNQKQRVTSLMMALRSCVTSLVLFVLLVGNQALAQINPADIHVSIIQGQSYSDTISSRFLPTAALVKNCRIGGFTSLGSQKYKMTILPPASNPGYLGEAMLVVQYTDGFPPKPRYITYHINFVGSKITAKEDFVVVDANNQANIQPLANDFTTSSLLSLSGIGQVQGGTATFIEDEIHFELADDAERGYIIYSLTDSLGATANGVVHILKQQTSVAQTDTVSFKLLNTRSQLVFLPVSGFTLTQAPAKGSITPRHSMVVEYKPNTGVSGNDIFKLTDGDNNQLVVKISLLVRSENTSSVRNDFVYTGKNNAVTFDVFANDLSTNFPISGYSPQLVLDTLGIFTYTPPTNYTGVQNFTYTVNYGTYQQTGNIRIFIGNYNPDITQDYSFNTVKNVPVVLDYNMPIDNYSFNVLNNPQFGAIEIFDSGTTITEDCNEINNKLTLLYTPDQNYYGTDSFDLEYCVTNNPCVVYKVNIKVFDNADTLCHCVGPDCVWAGDLDHNGKVSVADLLSLGRFIGLSGQQRDDIDYLYYGGQHASDWAYTQPNGNNIKHIDSDGDGLLTASDTSAISGYYGNIHNFVPEEVLSFKDYDFALIPNETELDSGDLLVLDVVIGSASKPVRDVFGLAFALDLNPSVIDSASLSGHFYEDSWFTYGTSSLQLIKQPKDGVIHAGFTRTAGIVEDELEGFKPPGAYGNGVIGQLVFIVEDELEGFKGQQNFLTRRISTRGIEMEDVDGERFRLPDTFVDIKVNLNKSHPVPTAEKLLVYPNPANDVLNLHFNGRNSILGYKIFDYIGNLVSDRENLDAQSTQIITSDLIPGIYMLQVITTQGVITKKIKIAPRG